MNSKIELSDQNNMKEKNNDENIIEELKNVNFIEDVIPFELPEDCKKYDIILNAFYEKIIGEEPNDDITFGLHCVYGKPESFDQLLPLYFFSHFVPVLDDRLEENYHGIIILLTLNISNFEYFFQFLNNRASPYSKKLLISFLKKLLVKYITDLLIP